MRKQAAQQESTETGPDTELALQVRSRIDEWLAGREQRRIAGYKLGAKRSGEKRRRQYEEHCIALAGEGLSRKAALRAGKAIREDQRKATKAVTKRIHSDRLRTAMPAWADRTAMEAVYAEAARMTRETGVRHEVDHVIPLLGKAVCGLHVEYNLMVVTRTQNRRKCNKMP